MDKFTRFGTVFSGRFSSLPLSLSSWFISRNRRDYIPCKHFILLSVDVHYLSITLEPLPLRGVFVAPSSTSQGLPHTQISVQSEPAAQGEWHQEQAAIKGILMRYEEKLSQGWLDGAWMKFQPWKCSSPGWMQLWTAWSSRKCPCP